eukprot:764713-Hanusia_phi.AAC.3
MLNVPQGSSPAIRASPPPDPRALPPPVLPAQHRKLDVLPFVAADASTGCVTLLAAGAQVVLQLQEPLQLRFYPPRHDFVHVQGSQELHQATSDGGGLAGRAAFRRISTSLLGGRARQAAGIRRGVKSALVHARYRHLLDSGEERAPAGTLPTSISLLFVSSCVQQVDAEGLQLSLELEHVMSGQQVRTTTDSSSTYKTMEKLRVCRHSRA